MKSTNANFHHFSQNFLSNLSSMHFLLFSAQAQIHRYFRQGPWKMLDQDIGPCQKLPMVLVSRPLFFWPVVNWPYCWYFCSKTMRVFSVELLMWLFQLWHNAVSGDIILRWALWTGRSWEFKDMLKRVWYTRCLVGIDIIDAVCTSLILLTVCTVDTPMLLVMMCVFSNCACCRLSVHRLRTHNRKSKSVQNLPHSVQMERMKYWTQNGAQSISTRWVWNMRCMVQRTETSLMINARIGITVWDTCVVEDNFASLMKYLFRIVFGSNLCITGRHLANNIIVCFSY